VRNFSLLIPRFVRVAYTAFPKIRTMELAMSRAFASLKYTVIVGAVVLVVWIAPFAWVALNYAVRYVGGY